jgi:hypothetical protein
MMRPASESSLARGCTTLSLEMVMECVPVRTADSAMVIDEEKCTGGLGPAETGGRMEWRLEDILLESFF